MKLSGRLDGWNVFGGLTIMLGCLFISLDIEGISGASHYIASGFGAFFVVAGLIVIICRYRYLSRKTQNKS